MAEFFGIALFTFFSEDLACIAAGHLAARAQMGLPAATAAAYLGIVTGDLLLYWAGYAGGGLFTKTRLGRHLLTAETLARGKRWIEQKGPAMVILSRFLPGTRLPTYVAAGVLRMPVHRFAALLLVAALLWTPLLVIVSFLSGSYLLERFQETPPLVRFVSMAGLILCIWLLSRLALSLSSWRGRRLLYSRWQRLLRWEFWPMWVLYIPVAGYLVYLALRHRCFAAFTAANPAIFASGIRGESKSAILRGLMPSPHNSGNVAPFITIRQGTIPEEGMILVQKFMRRQSLTFPIVLKPDSGERGNGVLIARNRAQVEAYLAETNPDTIVQEYIGGHEYGIFYYRYPEDREGKILSITDKRLLTLRGDGRSTIEELILRDGRAILMAKFHIQNHRLDLDRVLEKDKLHPLVKIGTHSKGALFLDGSHLSTAQLIRRIDRISKNFDGFFFGRYDVRVPNEADLKAGRNIRILELNGVTSEATGMYDPRHSLLHAFKTLFQQWRIAVEIGLQNIKRGTKPAGCLTLLSLAIGKLPESSTTPAPPAQREQARQPAIPPQESNKKPCPDISHRA
ncbi:MAG: VTT domain-containing protein [Spirochaetales bacterium]|nr:VTT domain-containing protein [Spirochaetales bacterium]